MDRTSDLTLPAEAPDFILSRIFDAPRRLLWQCWTDPTHLSRWWGPEGFTSPLCEIDLKPGGAFRLVIRSPDGQDYPMRGIFREILPLERIVKEDDVSEHSEQWHDLVDPDRKGQGKRPIPMLTTVTFEDAAQGTRVTVKTSFPSLQLRDNFVKAGMKEGWSSSFDRLAALSDALKASDREINVIRTIRAPVARVFRAFSEPAGLARWWGPNGFTTTTHHMDFRVGGHWHYTMHGPDGRNYPNYVSYIAITPERSIAYDHGTDATNPKLFDAVISFTSKGDATEVHLRLILPDAAQRPHFVGFGAVEGAYQNLARLDAYLEGKLS